MTTPHAGARFAEVWRADYAYLVNVAFRMLGDIGDAEDVVQEAFSRLAVAFGTEHVSEEGDIADARGWLTVVVSRLCLDQIRSARSRRERPTANLESQTPLAISAPVDPADRITLDDQVRTALQVVLERLGPAERVAFVLHDVFRTPFRDIAATLGRPVASCRQLARRARQKIDQVPLRAQHVDDPEHQLITEKFITACSNGHIDGLLEVLAPDVWGLAEVAADPPVKLGADRGAAAVAANMLRYYGPGTTVVSHPTASQPTLLGYLDRTLFAVLSLSVEGGRISSIHARIVPDQLHPMAARSTRPTSVGSPRSRRG
jgi:RNA polymerase sigma-70 factor (ECF subfamily)